MKNGECAKQQNHWDTKKYGENILKRNLFWWCFASKVEQNIKIKLKKPNCQVYFNRLDSWVTHQKTETSFVLDM